MGHFFECAEQGISASKCADINLEKDIGFNFGTNTGLALELAQITSPEELQFHLIPKAELSFYSPRFSDDPKKNFVEVNEREKVNVTQVAPVQVESPVILEVLDPPKGIVNTVRQKIAGASTGEKLAGVGIGATILRLIF